MGLPSRMIMLLVASGNQEWGLRNIRPTDSDLILTCGTAETSINSLMWQDRGQATAGFNDCSTLPWRPVPLGKAVLTAAECKVVLNR